MHTTRTRMFPNPSLYAYSSTTSQPAIAPTLSSLPTQGPLPLDGDGTKCGWIEDAGAYEWGRSEHTICPVKSWCFFPRLPSAVSSAVRRRGRGPGDQKDQTAETVIGPSMEPFCYRLPLMPGVGRCEACCIAASRSSCPPPLR